MAAKKKKKLERFIALGSSQFAVAALEALKEHGSTPELLVNRRVADPETGARTRRSPAARWAKRNDIPRIVPEDHKKNAWVDKILEDPPDLVLALGWNSALPPQLVDAPPLGCIGLHASALPKYRGANPVRACLAAGESSTGVTLYRIEGSEWDGPILASESLDIASDETYGELLPRVSEVGGQLAVELVKRFSAGRKFTEKKQDNKRRTKTARLGRRHRKPPWWLKSDKVYDRLRAYLPEPGLECFIRGMRLEIVRGKPMEWMRPTFGDTGTYLGLRTGRIAVLCDQSTVFGIERIRRVGEEPVSAARFAREYDLEIGSYFV